eukprot:gene11017-11171_t
MANYTGLHPGVGNSNHSQEPSPYLTITSNVVSDSQLTTALWLNTLLGMLCFIAFCFLQRSVFPRHYRYRMVSQSVTVKPKSLPTEGPESLWAWLVQALTATDAEILRSSGLDAMVMIKALAMGVQIFLPLAVIGCGVLLPLHYTQRSSDDNQINRSQLMALTIAALPRGSSYMWVHFVLIVVYNAWIMFVLALKYREFSVVRMHYLTKGDDPNYWMALTQQAEAEFMSRKVRKMLLDVDKTVAQLSQGGPPAPAAAVEGDNGPSPPPSTMRDSMLSVTASKMSHWWKAVTSKALHTHTSARNSIDSYKQYNSSSSTPGITPPTLSPEASSAGTVPAWGRIRMMRSSSSESQGQEQPVLVSDGFRAAGMGPMLGSAATSAGPAATASGSEGGAGFAPPAAAAGAGGRRFSGGSSSGSDAGTSGAGTVGGAAGPPAVAAGDVGTRGGRGRRQGSPGRRRGDAEGGLKPTYQTISELHSVTAQEESRILLIEPDSVSPMVPILMIDIITERLSGCQFLSASGGSVAITQRSSAYGTVSDMSARFSVDSGGGLSSICTRITHNSDSIPSSPASGSSMGSQEEAEGCCNSSQADAASESSWVTGSSRASRDISFGASGQSAGGSGAQLQLSPGLEAEYFVPSAARRTSDEPAPVSSADVHLEGIPEDAPAAAAARFGGGSGTVDGLKAQQGHESTVDFTAAGLLDYSRSSTPLSPQDGGLLSPQPVGNRSSRRNRSGRWSPFASSDTIAANIAAEGVAGSRVPLSGAVPGAEPASSHANGSSGQLHSYRSADHPSAAQNSAAGMMAADQWAQLVGGSGAEGPATAFSAGGGSRSNTAAASTSMRESALLHALQDGPGSTQAGSEAGSMPAHPAQRERVQSYQGFTCTTRAFSAPFSAQTSPSAGDEEQPLQHHQGMPPWHTSWQSMSQSRVTGSSSSNGHSRLVSPLASVNPTPREGGAVAGAAVGAGIRPVPAAHAALAGVAPGALNLTPVLDVDGPTLQSLADAGVILNGGPGYPGCPGYPGEELNGWVPGSEPQPVAFCWWKELPNHVRPSDENQTHLGVDDWVNKYDNQPLLAKPSVRFRKTINVRIKRPQANEPEMKAANAQHYCVLVTDVKQWPYPELQLAANLQQKPHWASTALGWVGSAVGRMPALLSWGLKGLAEDHQHSEEQQLLPHFVQRHSTDGQELLAQPQVGKVLSDMHPPQPGSAVPLGNPLARLSHMSGISYTTHLPDTLEECDSFLALADRQVEDAKQKVMLDGRLTPEEREHKLRKVDKARQELIRWAVEQKDEQDRRQQLAREHSLMHLDPVSRTASFLKPNLAPFAGPAGAAACLSRAHSSKAMQLSARADNAVAGAAVGTPEFSSLASRRPSAIGSLQHARAHTPAALSRETSGALPGPGGAGGAGALQRDRAGLQVERQHWQRQRTRMSMEQPISGYNSGPAAAPSLLGYPAAPSAVGSDASQPALISLDSVSSPLADAAAAAANAAAFGPPAVAAAGVHAHRRFVYGQRYEGGQVGQHLISPSNSASAAAAAADLLEGSPPVGRTRSAFADSGVVLQPQADSSTSSQPAGGPGSPCSVMPGSAGLSDSYDSSVSSYNTSRPMVSFKPVPPRSPRSVQQFRPLDQLQGGDAPGRRFPSSPVLGGPGGPRGHSRQHVRQDPSLHSEGSASRLGPAHTFGGASYGSGGGAPAARTAALGGPAFGRSKSARYSSSSSQTDSIHQHSHASIPADHLSVLIPPMPHGPPSRTFSPLSGGSGGGAASIGYGGLSPQPWGLPADAATIKSSLTMVNQGLGSPRAAGPNARTHLAQQLKGRSRRMSIPGKWRGWARVRFALYYRNYNRFHNCKSVLLRLPEMEMYSIVTSTFNRLFPKDFDRAIPVFNHKKVDLLLMDWEAAVAALEKAEMTRERTGREPLRLDNASEARQCLGLIDSFPDAMQDRVIKLEEDIEAARREAFQSSFTPSWFVHPAPGPEEVNWQHLWMTWRERDCRTILVWPFTLAIVLFPITLMTSAASRLDYVFCPALVEGQPTPAFYWDWYCINKTVGGTLPSFLRAFITGWLPNLLLNLWLVMVLPRLVYLLVQSEGSCFSLSALERRIGAVFFYWDIFNVFLQGTIGSSFFMQVRKIIQAPEQLPSILGAALPDSSNFFMQFIAMRALFLIWLRMCVPHGDRDKSLTYGPRTPRYGFEMGHMLLMYLIAIAFSIVSPLLLPFSVVWFAFAWVAWRHNLSYVYQRKYESGGLMWMFLFSRIVMCLVVGQLFTFCVLVVRGAYWQAFLIIAFMPALTARYYKYCQARFARGVEYGVPLDTAQRNDANREAQVPAHVYIPPPLQNRSWGWYPEWNKMWDGWGMPAYSV